MRAETLTLKARDFTRAAQALGACPLRIIISHILPNAMGSVVVFLTVIAFNFLGDGLQDALDPRSERR